MPARHLRRRASRLNLAARKAKAHPPKVPIACSRTIKARLAKRSAAQSRKAPLQHAVTPIWNRMSLWPNRSHLSPSLQSRSRRRLAKPVLSARDAILRRLGPVPAPFHVEPASDAGPGPFSRPQPAPAAPAPAASLLAAAPPAAPMPSVSASAAQAPFFGPTVNPEPSPETNEALRSALATLQRMSARG